MQPRKRRRGQSLLLFAVSLPLVLAILGVLVDSGFGYYRRHAALSAAQAAALAAVIFASKSTGGSFSCGAAVPCTGSSDCSDTPTGAPSTSLEAGCQYARANGYGFTQNGKIGVGLTPGSNNSPPTVPGVNASYWVTAVITETVPLSFAAVFGKTTATVSARATAAGFAPNPGNGGCIYVLEQTATGISNSGNGTVESGCGVYVNSSSTEAVRLSGNGLIKVNSSAPVSIHGDWSHSGNGDIQPRENLKTYAPAVADPFADMPAPPEDACSISGFSLSSSSHKDLSPCDPGGTMVINGSIRMSGKSSVSLARGTYILKGGLDMSGQTSISGTGVTLFVASGGIDMSGTGNVVISAPDDGDYQGVLIFQPKSNTTQMNLTGGASQLLTGLVYMPGAELRFSGNGGATGTTTTIAARSIDFTGNAHIDSPASTKYSGGGPGSLALVE